MHTDYILVISSSWMLLMLISNLAVFLYVLTIFNVGRARGRYKVTPPATSGQADFERYYRVQQNTLEQLTAFLPALWMFAMCWQTPKLSSALGALWLAGRIFYALCYYKNAGKRLPGFVIGQLTTVFLLLGSLFYLLKALL